MDDTDAFFTRTIVGAPCSVMLGRRASVSRALGNGVQVDMRSGRSRLSGAWKDFVLLGRADDWRGQPRRRPGAVTRWLERHALVIAAMGLLALMAATAILVARALSWI